MAKISEKSEWKDQEITYTWIPTKELKNYKPVSQIYGICLNDENKILVIKDKDRWQIPGGTPEGRETPEQTLKREMIEEAQAEIGRIVPLGVQEVNYFDNPNKKQGDLFYQYRYVTFVKKLNPMQSDPATGRLNERRFVSFDEIDDYVKWGRVGQEMFKDAKILVETI